MDKEKKANAWFGAKIVAVVSLIIWGIWTAVIWKFIGMCAGGMVLLFGVPEGLAQIGKFFKEKKYLDVVMWFNELTASTQAPPASNPKDPNTDPPPVIHL